MKSSLPHLEIILPVFNEVENIQPLLSALDEAATVLKAKAHVTYLFVNDGSTDGSRELLHRIHASRSDLRVVDLIHNFGHGAALAAGLEHFDADAALVMDADLQDSPRSIIPMFEAWQKGAKTVVAERGARKERSRLLFKGFYLLLHRMAPGLPPMNFGTHCLLDKTVIKRLLQMKERNRYLPGLVGYSSGKIVSIKFDRQDRAHGTSRVGFMGLVNLALTAILSFSNAPIRLVSTFGVFCAGSALILGFSIVSIKLFTPWAIPGWASVTTLITFTSGIQLLCLGLIGEYIGRIYEEVKQRPLYLVENVLELKSRSKAA